jgi:hypothetical protein
VKTVIATAGCHCTGHSGCLHRPGQCRNRTRRGDHCGWCRGRWMRAVEGGLRTMRSRRPQDDLAVFERSSK